VIHAHRKRVLKVVTIDTVNRNLEVARAQCDDDTGFCRRDWCGRHGLGGFGRSCWIRRA
jgi:hypothetical protein